MEEIIDKVLKSVVGRVKNSPELIELSIDEQELQHLLERDSVRDRVRDRVRVVVEEGSVLKETKDQDYVESFLSRSLDNIAFSIVRSYTLIF